MRAVARGDTDAVGELYDRHASAVYGMAMSVLRDPTVAQDVTQETFVRLWTRAQAFDAHRGTLLGWLLAVTRNLALDELRRQRRASERAELLMREATVQGTGDLDLLLQRGWDSQRVRDALGELSTLQRQTVELVYFQGYTLTEVAERLAVAVGTVKSRLHSALTGLRGALSEESSSATGPS
ncbi:MAG: sigma-70 family RNA polymerase sigma factor [Chloroflexi bacterium]|nr:sigma-70 family RNA polymerase sigma factor [Chloroflexota bacterium]